MKGGYEISIKCLNSNADECRMKIQQVMTLKKYGKGYIKSYVNEMDLIFKNYNHKNVNQSRYNIDKSILYKSNLTKF